MSSMPDTHKHRRWIEWPNRCHAHMIEINALGNCGYCGRPAHAPLGPPRIVNAAIRAPVKLEDM